MCQIYSCYIIFGTESKTFAMEICISRFDLVGWPSIPKWHSEMRYWELMFFYATYYWTSAQKFWLLLWKTENFMMSENNFQNCDTCKILLFPIIISLIMSLPKLVTNMFFYTWWNSFSKQLERLYLHMQISHFLTWILQGFNIKIAWCWFSLYNYGIFHWSYRNKIM